MYEITVSFGTAPSNAKIVDAAFPLSASPSAPTQLGQLSDPQSTSVTQERPAAASNDVQNPEWEAIEQTLNSIQQSLAQLDLTRRESLDEMQQAVVELAVSIASHLVYRSIDAGVFGVDELVKEMLQPFTAGEHMTVRLHPDDLQTLRRSMADQAPPWKDWDNVELLADEEIGRGNCRVDSDDTGMLSRIDLQLSEIRQHLLECLDDAESEDERHEAAHRHLRRFAGHRRSA